MIDDIGLLTLLNAIKVIALSPHPFPPAARHDPQLVLAMSEIACVAQHAIAGHLDRVANGERSAT
jgi:hypothetical protein